VPALLEIVEECEHQRRIKIRERERDGYLLRPLLSKAQQQTERIPIARHGPRTGVLLINQALTKEVLQ